MRRLPSQAPERSAPMNASSMAGCGGPSMQCSAGPARTSMPPRRGGSRSRSGRVAILFAHVSERYGSRRTHVGRRLLMRRDTATPSSPEAGSEPSPMSEPLASPIEALAQRISPDGFRSEPDISQGVVTPVLHELPWPVFNVQVVPLEFTISSRNVDYALCHPPGKPAGFLEVKPLRKTEGQGERQLFEYSFNTPRTDLIGAHHLLYLTRSGSAVLQMSPPNDHTTPACHIGIHVPSATRNRQW